MAAHSGPGLTGNTFTVTSTAQRLVAKSDRGWRTVVVLNTDSTNPVYIGGHGTADLTASNGFRLAAGQSFSIDLHPAAELWAVSGGSIDVRVLEVEGSQV